MTVFLASYLNAVDRKGRVSVPATFRAEMAGHTRQTVVVYAAPQVAVAGGEQQGRMYLYAWAYDDFVKLAERINQLPPFSATRQRLARTILAAARPLNIEDTGRIQLPENLLQAAQITDCALVAGEGGYFTLWQPAAFDAQAAADSAFHTEDLAALNALWG